MPLAFATTIVAHGRPALQRTHSRSPGTCDLARCNHDNASPMALDLRGSYEAPRSVFCCGRATRASVHLKSILQRLHIVPRLALLYSAGIKMNFFSKLYYKLRKYWKAIQLYLVIAGPGIVVMVADNDAGGITTYAATGAKYGYQPDLVPADPDPGRLLRAGDDGAPGRGHQARPRRGDLRRLRRVLGLVFADRPDDRGLADAGHRIHRHDLGAAASSACRPG